MNWMCKLKISFQIFRKTDNKLQWMMVSMCWMQNYGKKQCMNIGFIFCVFHEQINAENESKRGQKKKRMDLFRRANLCFSFRTFFITKVRNNFFFIVEQMITNSLLHCNLCNKNTKRKIKINLVQYLQINKPTTKLSTEKKI